jgi:sentrin-specific protease 1
LDDFSDLELVEPEVPQQNNGFDCGIFLLVFAKYCLEEKEFDFGQIHMKYFRRQFAFELLSIDG